MCSASSRARIPANVYAQEYEAQFLGIESEPCETCRWPDPDEPIFLDLYEGEERGSCPECARMVGPDGRSISEWKMEFGYKEPRPMKPHWDMGCWVDAYGHPLKTEPDAPAQT